MPPEIWKFSVPFERAVLRDHSRRQRDEREYVAPVERHVGDDAALHHLALGRAFGLQQRGLRGDFHLLVDGAQFHDGVDADDVLRFDRDRYRG